MKWSWLSEVLFFKLVIHLFIFVTIFPIPTLSQTLPDIVVGHTDRITSTLPGKEIGLSIHLPDTEQKGPFPVLVVFQTHFEQVAGTVKNLYDYGLVPGIFVVSINDYEYGYLTPSVVDGTPHSGQARSLIAVL